MKKLILITGILLSTSLWADMDKQCYIFIDSFEGTDSYFGIADYISENCERNNIVTFASLEDGKEVFNWEEKGKEPRYMQIPFGDLIATWCRYDRNVNTTQRLGERTVSCVLYSNKPREIIE